MKKPVIKFSPEELNQYVDYDLIQLHRPDSQDSRGKKRGKTPINKGWRRAIPLTIKEASSIMTEKGSNIGVRLKDTDLIIDVDPRHFKEGDDPFKRLQNDLNVSFLSAPKVITGSGGLHVYLKKPSDLSIRDSLEDYEGIEFKSLGRQVVAAGSIHPDTFNIYAFDPLSNELSEAPNAPQSLLEVIKKPGRLADVTAGKLKDRPEALEEALAFLNPSDFGEGNHDKWLRLMMSCHHATAGEGRAEFIEWCALDPNYSSEVGSVGRRWDSLHSEGDKIVSYKYLFGLIVEKGEAGRAWVRQIDRLSAEQDFPDYHKNINGAEESLDEILASIPEGSKDVNEALEWFNNNGFCAVMDDGQFKIMRQVIDTSCRFIDVNGRDEKPRKRWESAKKQDFLNFYETKKVEHEKIDSKGDIRKTTVKLAPLWLGWAGRKEYEGVIFDPAGRYKNKRFLNLWTDWAVQPCKGDWSLLQELLKEGLCDGSSEAYEYCLNWAAYMVQNPDLPAEVALVFKGSKGVGKGTFGRALARLCGRHSLQISNQSHFTNNFNAHLRDCIFLFADEAIWAGDKKAEGDLKRLITEDTLAIEAKFKDVIHARNMLHIVMASNEDWVVPASLDDERRFAVFEVNKKFQGNMDFFQSLNSQLDNGGLKALLWDLKTRDITNFHPRRGAPKTLALAKQKLASMDYVDTWWYNCLLNASLGKDIKSVSGEWELNSVRFTSFDIQQSLELYLQRVGDKSRARRSTMTAIGDRLKKRLPQSKHIRFKPPSDRLSELSDWVSKDGRTYGYDFPPIAECRLTFEKQLGQKLEWDEGIENVD